MSSGDWAWLIAGTAAAGTVTYFTCVRPMRQDKGQCAVPGTAATQTRSCHYSSFETDSAQEIARLRAERESLTEIVALREERASLLAAHPPDTARAGQKAEW